MNPGIFKAYDIRGIHGERPRRRAAPPIGRAFARVIGEMEDKPTAELRLGLGRDMRLTAPEMAAAYASGMAAEGAHVLDAGQVGTEMLYFLVGSRDLDGGLMCTASHNPKAYTGRQAGQTRRDALSGDEGIGDVQRLVVEHGCLEPTSPRPAAASSRSRSTTISRSGPSSSSTPRTIGR